MFCTSCGKQIDNDSKFCPFCGVKTASGGTEENSTVISTADPPVAQTSTDMPTFTPPEQENGNSVNTASGTEADNPSFKAPGDDIPTFKAPNNDMPSFTPPPRSHFDGQACYYHDDEPAVGKCARCGKPLCEDCCDSYGVSAGEYSGKNLCYDCTQQLVADNIAQLTANLNKIKAQFILQIVGMVIGFIWGMSADFGTALIMACIGGVFLRALKAFGALAWDCIKIAFNGQFGVLTVISIIFNLIVIVFKCIGITISQTIQYITYIKKTSGFIESDSKFLEQIKEYMEYTMIRQQNRGVDLETLMQKGSQLYNNSFAQMVRDQGEEKAEAYMSQCVTRIAENGEIIRDFPQVA